MRESIDAALSRTNSSSGIHDTRSRTGAIHSSNGISGASPLNSSGPRRSSVSWGRLSFSDGKPTVVSHSGIDTNFPSSEYLRPWYLQRRERACPSPSTTIAPRWVQTFDRQRTVPSSSEVRTRGSFRHPSRSVNGETRPGAFTRAPSPIHCQLRAKTRSFCSSKYSGSEYTRAGSVDARRMSLSISKSRVLMILLKLAQSAVRLRPPIPVELPDVPDLADLVEVELRRDQLVAVPR